MLLKKCPCGSVQTLFRCTMTTVLETRAIHIVQCT